MLIGPLVFSTLVVGIAHMGDAASVGRVVRQGAGLVHHRVAGLAGARPDPRQPAAAGPQPRPAAARHRRLGQPRHRQVHRSRTSSPTWCRSPSPRRWPTTRSCRSWSSRCSSAWRSPRWARRRKTLVAVIDELAHVMLKITGYVMKLAPLAVFAAMAATVAINGLAILLTLRGLHGRLLPRPDPPLGPAGLRRLRRPRAARLQAAVADQGAVHARPSPPPARRRPTRRSSMRSTASA